MPEKFKRFIRIAFIFFISVSLIELTAFFVSLLLGYYFIAERLISSLITTVFISAILLLTRNQWQAEKVNPQLFHCPKCGEEKPLARIPKNFKQMITGGWTCAKCGTEVFPQNKNSNLIWMGICLSMILIGIAIFLVTYLSQ